MPTKIHICTIGNPRHSIYNFSLVSRGCHTTTTSSISDDNRQELIFGDIYGESDHLKLYTFLRSLIRGAVELGQVRKLVITAGGNSDDLPEHWTSVKDDFFHEQDWKQIDMLVKKVTADQDVQQAYITDLRAGHWDSVVTLILSFLSNLEELEIFYWAGPGVLLRSYIEEVSRIQAGEQSILNESNSLPRLKKVKLSFDSYDEAGVSMSWEAVTVWSALSTVRELQACSVREDYEEQNSETLPDKVTNSTCFNRPCNVEKLELIAAIAATTLSDFLVRCPRLKHFDYTHDNVFDHSDAFNHGNDFHPAALFEPPRFRRALLQVRNTLEYLRVEPGLTDFNTEYVSKLCSKHRIEADGCQVYLNYHLAHCEISHT